MCEEEKGSSLTHGIRTVKHVMTYCANMMRLGQTKQPQRHTHASHLYCNDCPQR